MDGMDNMDRKMFEFQSSMLAFGGEVILQVDY